MAAGKPIVINMADLQGNVYLPEVPPFLAARNIDEIYQRLFELNDSATRERKSEESLQWILKYHGSKTIVEKYIKHYIEALTI